MTPPLPDLGEFLRLYRAGHPRARIFHDAVLSDVRRHGPGSTVLDIGCGRGLDGNSALQESLARVPGRLIGIEPDERIRVAPCFGDVQRCAFEDAVLAPSAVHVAYSVMVLEHIHDPAVFWRKLLDALCPGGVFWALTVDRRHWFTALSRLMGALRVKDFYLSRVRGKRGTERYENYPTYYRANSPRQVRKHARGFSVLSFASLHRVGQLGFYLPRWLKPAGRLADRLNVALGLPGSVLVMRLVK